MRLQVEESEFIYCDLQAILGHIHRQNPEAAVRFLESFRASINLLSQTPEIGRSRTDLNLPEIRSWKVGDFRRYLIFYEILPDRLRILRVLHGSRDLGSILPP